MELLIVSDVKMLSIYVKSSGCGLFVVSLRDCVYIVFFNKKDINLIFPCICRRAFSEKRSYLSSQFSVCFSGGSSISQTGLNQPLSLG